MTESSDDKTVRKFIAVLDEYLWIQQVTIFYANYDDRLLAVRHKPIITDRIRKLFPEQAFLYRLCINPETGTYVFNTFYGGEYSGSEETVAMPYHTFFTNIPIDITTLEQSLCKSLDCHIYVKQRNCTGWRRVNYIKKLKLGKPDDLLSFFPDLKHQRRWAFIGKQWATPKAPYDALRGTFL